MRDMGAAICGDPCLGWSRTGGFVDWSWTEDNNAEPL